VNNENENGKLSINPDVNNIYDLNLNKSCNIISVFGGLREGFLKKNLLY
jgi:hypothetical protein